MSYTTCDYCKRFVKCDENDLGRCKCGNVTMPGDCKHIDMAEIANSMASVIDEVAKLDDPGDVELLSVEAKQAFASVNDVWRSLEELK